MLEQSPKVGNWYWNGFTCLQPSLFAVHGSCADAILYLCVRCDAVAFNFEQQEQVDPKESPYFDSLCRSFLLGVGAGALVETGHMLSKLVQTPDVAGGLADCAAGQQEAAGPAVKKHGSQVVCNGVLLVLKVGTRCWQQQAAVYHLLVIS